jgi:hypothetical protein
LPDKFGLACGLFLIFFIVDNARKGISLKPKAV